MTHPLDRPDPARELARRSNLTPHQLAMWLASELYPGVPLHHLATVFTLAAPIEVEHFRRAFQALVDSSDALRTVIETVHGTPRQRVLESMRRPLDYVDLSHAPDPEGAAAAWVRARAGLPLDLADCPYDTALIRTGEARFAWFVHVQHAVFDGASAFLMAHLMGRCYGESLAGTLPARLSLPRFQDYVRDALEYRHSPDAERAQAFWTERLPADAEPLLLYGETPRKTTTASLRITRTLTPAQMGRLDALAAGAGLAFPRTTMFAILVAVLAALLHRIGGARRFCIGVPVHNRRTRVQRDTLGLLMQVVPLPVRIDADDTFLSLLARIARDAMASWRHAEYTIPTSGHRPLYDAVLNFHTPLDASIGGAPARAVLLPSGHQLESLGLHVHDMPQAGVLTVDFDLHADVFPPERRELVVSQFFRVLDAALEDPRQGVADIRLLSADEERRLLVGLNSARLPLPERLTYPALFEARAERTPAAVAAVYEGQTLTYAELNARANQLARALRARGVGPETRVGVLMESSLDVAVAVLGVLKAGGAHVPLDAAYPRERTAFMLRDADVRHLLTEGRLLGALPEHEADVLCVDRDWAAISRHESGNPAHTLAPDHLAYVVYTSGATGAPKGVMLTHRSLCSRLLWGARTFGVDESECYLQNASWAYDASVWALLEPWVAGGRAVIARSDSRSDGRYLVRLMRAAKVTFVAASPTMLEILLDAGGIESCAALRHVFAWGEPLTPALADRFLARSSAALYNVYGQTETCISVTHWRCPAGTAARTVPIGAPHANTEVYILDPARRPVPVGVPGELYVGGAGVARGYLNRPELTAERFVPSPFDAGARLFRTGDLGRFAPDGTIECLGRIDRQIKIRGNRVELGEVEAVLGRYPGVRECAVVARPGEAGGAGGRVEPRLVAYFVSDAAIPSTDLRRLCRGALPGFMVPAAFVRVDALPHTSSGKIDERRLPPPGPEAQARVDDVVPPRDAVEEVVARIWAEVLDVESVSVDANFFDAGGDSLRGVQLMMQVEAAFELEAPARWLIEAPTVAGIAERVREGREARAASPPAPIRATTGPEGASSLVALRRDGSKRPFFLVAGGAGAESELLVYANLAPHLGVDQPLYGVLMRDLGTGGVEELARRLVQDVTRLQPAGPYLLGGECIGGMIAFEMAQQLRARGEEVALLALLDTVSEYAAPPRIGSLAWTIDGVRRAAARVRGVAAGMPLLTPHSESLFRRRAAVRRHLAAIAAYRPGPYGGPLDVVVSERWHRKSATLGWDALARGGLRVHVVPGDHASYIRTHARDTAEVLSACLERSQGGGQAWEFDLGGHPRGLPIDCQR